MPVARSDSIRDFYRRFAAALPNPGDRDSFEGQLSSARIIPVDNEHDRFELQEDLGPFAALY
ncbi:MAG: hypothetical protein ACXWNL_16535, partial [Vulcanimicrobiaceae bacterium]